MEITQTLYVVSRGEWRKWLAKNYKTAPDVWLIYYRKDSGKPRVPYNDAVEEALCFGWIDSTMKKIDKDGFAQRFSPRKLKSGYSQLNKERLIKLIAQKKVMPEVLEAIKNVMAAEFTFPPDIMVAIKADKEAWQNFQAFPDQYKRIRIAFIEGARQHPEEFQKRLNYFIKMTAQNKRFGTIIK